MIFGNYFPIYPLITLHQFCNIIIVFRTCDNPKIKVLLDKVKYVVIANFDSKNIHIQVQ